MQGKTLSDSNEALSRKLASLRSRGKALGMRKPMSPYSHFLIVILWPLLAATSCKAACRATMILFAID